MENNLYLSGGVLKGYLYQDDGSISTTGFDLGVIEMTLSHDSESVTAFTRAYGLKQDIEEVVTSIKYTLKIKSNTFSPENLSLALASYYEKYEVKAGDTLPNGEIAKEDATFTTLKASSKQAPRVKLVFTGVPVSGKQVIAVFYSVNLKLDGDLSYVGDEFGTLELTGSLNKCEQGYYTHYIKESHDKLPDYAGQGGTKPTPKPKVSKKIKALIVNIEDKSGYSGTIAGLSFKDKDGKLCKWDKVTLGQDKISATTALLDSEGNELSKLNAKSTGSAGNGIGYSGRYIDKSFASDPVKVDVSHQFLVNSGNAVVTYTFDTPLELSEYGIATCSQDGYVAHAADKQSAIIVYEDDTQGVAFDLKPYDKIALKWHKIDSLTDIEAPKEKDTH